MRTGIPAAVRTAPGTELAVLGEWYQDHVSFNDMLGTTTLRAPPPVCRGLPLHSGFLWIRGCTDYQVLVTGIFCSSLYRAGRLFFLSVCIFSRSVAGNLATGQRPRHASVFLLPPLGRSVSFTHHGYVFPLLHSSCAFRGGHPSPEPAVS